MAEFQWKVWKDKLFFSKCLWISYFFLNFYLHWFSVICLSLSEIPIWTHQREFGLICPYNAVSNLTQWSYMRVLKNCSENHLWQVDICRFFPHSVLSAPWRKIDQCWEGKQGQILWWSFSTNLNFNLGGYIKSILTGGILFILTSVFQERGCGERKHMCRFYFYK